MNSTQLIKRITLKRFGNAFAVLGSYYYSRLTRIPVQWGFPVSIAIEPTTSCNLRCPECPSGLRNFSRPTGMLEENFFRKVIDEIYTRTFYLTFYFQGEPYLNKKFLDMVKYARSKKMYTATSTNAHYLDDETAKQTIESGLDKLIISIDGTTQDTYEQYRVGGELEKVIKGTKNIIRWKKQLKSKSPYVVFQYLVVKPNEHQTQDVMKLAKELGVDEVTFKTAQVYDYAKGNPLIPDNENYSRYRKNSDGSYSLKNKLLNHCWKLWHSCVITWDGKVVPCCFDKDAKHPMGSLQEKSFREIWQDEAYRDFRRSLLKSRSEIDICKNCSEGTKVWV